MVSNNADQNWKEAFNLLEATKAKWDESTAEELQLLNPAALEFIDKTYQSLQRFASVHSEHGRCLLKFYEGLEKYCVILVLAAKKIDQIRSDLN